MEDRDRREGRRWRARAGVLAALAALLVLHGSVNLWWLRHDNHPAQVDEARQVLLTKACHRAMTDDGPGPVGRLNALAGALPRGGPPLFPLASASIMAFQPGDPAVPVFVNTAVLLLLLMAVFLLAGRFFDRWTALAAAAVTGFMPLVFGVSRLFLHELLASLFVVLAVWCLCMCDRLRNTTACAALGACFGFGLLAAPATGLHYIAPALVVLGAAALWTAGSEFPTGRLRLKLVARNLAVVVLLSAAIPAPWHAARLAGLGDSQGNGTSFEAPHGAFRQPALALGTGSPGTPDGERCKPYSPWLLTAFGVWTVNKGLFLPTALLAAAGLVAAVAWRRRNRNLCLLVAWVLGSYVAVTALWHLRVPNPRDILPVLPAAGILSVLALAGIRRMALRWCVASVFLALLVFQYANMTLGGPGRGGELAVPLPGDHPCMRAERDAGLVVWTEKVYSGGALLGPPVRGRNWVDRVLDAVEAREYSRHYVTGPEAVVRVVGLHKESVEAVQSGRWPLANPADPRSRRVRSALSPYHPLQPDRTDPGEIFTAPGTPAHAPHGAISMDYGEPAKLGAVAIEFAQDTPLPSRFIARYYDGLGGGFKDFDPPAAHRGASTGFHFMGFSPVAVTTVRFAFFDEEDRPMPVTVSRFECFSYHPQPRPIVAVRWHGPHDREDGTPIPAPDYIVWSGELPGHEQPWARDDFEVIATFRALTLGHWDEQRVNVLARRQHRPVALGAEPALRVDVSGGQHLPGRWDVPWWRFGAAKAPWRPDEDCWAAPAPATATADFGRPYNVYAVEAVPYSPARVPGPVSVSWWDEAESAWQDLAQEQVHVADPRHGPGSPHYGTKTLPTPWTEPVQTRRIRFVLLGDPSAEGAGATVFVSGLHIYGEPIDNE